MAVVGAGGWGKNLVRNFAAVKGARLLWCCDLNEAILTRLAPQLPGTRMTTRVEDVLGDPDVAAVAIATDAPTHYLMARQALEAGKHVYVEKPLTLEASTSRELIRIAEERQADHGGPPPAPTRR
jgi:UDP-2-acetamido-3-amino-2,3-dideoxy-glucuronate N-acetyltransferase